MIETISEERIKDILKDYDGMLRTIDIKMQNLYENLMPSGETDAVIKEAAIPPVNMSGMPGAHKHKDLTDVLVKVQRMEYEREREFRAIMWALSEEKEEICRVWGCFQAVGNPYYTILLRLYVQHELYETVNKELDMSQKTFEYYRRDGIAFIKRFYESGKPIPDIMRIARNNVNRRKRSHQKETVGQMSFEDLME